MQILDGRKHFYQWDSDVFITSEDFVEGEEIHFANGVGNNALVVKAELLNGKIVASVPNNMLQIPTPIKAYRYLQDKQGNRTVDESVFEVQKKQKPDDYVYTETEIFNFYDLKKEIEDIMGDVSSALDELHNYAQSLVSGGESK